MRILAVVEGTAQTNRVVEYLTMLATRGAPIDIFVLNVQSKRRDHRLRGYQTFKQSEIDNRLIKEFGMPIVSHISRRLEKAGLRVQGRVEIGEPVETILGKAMQEHCDAIVIGGEKPGMLHRWLAGTLGLSFGPAASLTVLSKLPVVVVK
ncbi:MAG: universal stress protein [Pseudorhodoplanes sp.]|jgi:nucleotide-binding universal stress UspA family protein|nr:universal stress protein [Pseudorhodoplanes sp.]